MSKTKKTEAEVVDKKTEELKHEPCPQCCKSLETMCKQAGVSKQGTDKPYLETPFWRHSMSRLPWLIFLLFAAIGCGLVVMIFEEQFERIPLLVAFIPLIMAIAGAGGSQTSTVAIRAMAVGEITTRQYLKAFWKEFVVSVVCGVVLGGVMFVYIIIVYNQGIEHTTPVMVGAVLWLGLIATVIFAKLLGMLLPILAKKVRIDPAMVSSPLVTIIADIFGIFAFFGLVMLML
jgi:magnesium transporter